MSKPSPTRSDKVRRGPSGARYLGPHAADARLDLTLVLRRRTALAPMLPMATRQQRHAEFAQRHGADPVDMQRLRQFSQDHQLQELACEPGRRALRVRGSVQAIEQAFGVQLGRYQMTAGGEPFVACAEAPAMPDPAVIAVLGLDRRPVARPHFRVAPRTQAGTSFTPPQLGALYRFPAGTDGSRQTVAIIELGGGYRQADLDTYFKGLGLAVPSVTAVPVDGGSNAPGSAADGEVMLDIEIAGALAPAAKLVVYFADNTDQGFYNAISGAAHSASQPATVMSISWGAPEDGWSAASRNAMESALEDAAALGITVTVAAGDNGFTDGEADGKPHVDYPASSPSVLACGGTTLVAGADAIRSEVVWNETASGNGATGGGVSTAFARPAWQAGAGVPAAPNGFVGRGVPDVAGDADPLTGYRVRVDGQDQVYGGTSAVAPLWAALLARINQRLGHDLEAANATLYAIGSQAWRDITRGDNGDYKAGTGWDACTGLGSPNGQSLLAALQAPPEGGAAPPGKHQ
ncbi:MAG: S8 family serine peptidase [Pseudomonadota bacterium]|nr:S8 family serine peptidase [Pseudomonadota bacterium]